MSTEKQPTTNGTELTGEQKRVLVEEIGVRTNVRKRFDPVELAELQESIKTKGLGVPLIVRPIPPTSDPVDKLVKNFELVAGEKRIRCVRALGWELVACQVMTLTDKEALEWQLIENLQRGDLDLLEEAEGYEQLLKLGEYSAKDLAVKMSKTPNYIYQRLKLLFLPETARQALLDGRLTFGHARAIACLPHQDWREEATKIVLNPKGCKVPGMDNEYWNHPEGEPLTGAQTTELLKSRYMRELKTAPFDQKDATLLSGAGPCTTCPKRAGNSPELFPNLRADMCTDQKCYVAKQEAARMRLVNEAETKGQKVMTAEQRDKVMHSGGQMKYGAAFVSLDEEPSYSEIVYGVSKKPKWSALVKGRDVPVVLAIDETGRVHKLVERKLAIEAGKANKPELFRKRETSAGSDSGKKEAEKREREAELDRATTAEVMDYLMVAIEKNGPSGTLFASAFVLYAETYADEVYGECDDYWKVICARRKLPEGTKVKPYVAKLNTAQAKLALTVEILLTLHEFSYQQLEFEVWTDAYKIDVKKIAEAMKTVMALNEAAAAQKAKDAKKPVPKKGKAAAPAKKASAK